MIVVHTALRRELRLASLAVRRVPIGDARRARVVGAHLALLFRVLEHHHQLEDQLVWPPLLDRLPADLVPTIDRMARQHERIVVLAAEVADVLPAWEATASADDQDRLARCLDEVHRAVTVHLDDEESEGLPLALEHLTRAEWDQIANTAESSHDRRDRLRVFGMLQYEGSPDVLAAMLGSAPAPARLLVPVLARRAFRRRALAIGGRFHPEADAELPLHDELATMTSDDTWVTSHALIAVATALLTFGLWTAHRQRSWPTATHRALRVGAAVMSLYFVETIFHLGAAVDTDALENGDFGPVSLTHVVLSVLLYPVAGLSLAWLSAAQTTAVSVSRKVFGIAGLIAGLLQAASVPLALSLPDTELSPVFAGAGILTSLWALGTGLTGVPGRAADRQIDSGSRSFTEFLSRA